MTPETNAQGLPPRRRAWLLVGLLITLVHAPVLNKPFVDSDEAVYASVAALTNSVGHLYGAGGVHNKFPGIYWIYALVFRVFGQYSMTAVHVFTILVVLATAAVLAKIALRIGHEPAGWLTALFYGIATTFYTPKMLGANTEVFTMLPLSVAALLTLPEDTSPRPGLSRLYMAGALVGAATVIRQLAAPNLALICVVPLFWQGTGWVRRLASSFVGALGFATVAALLAYFFFQEGTLRDFWFWTVFVVGQRYLPDGWHYAPPWHQLGMLAETSVFWVFVALRARKWSRLSFLEKAIWGWLALSIAIVIFPGRFHPHYVIQALAPLSVLSALEFAKRLEGANTPRDVRLLRWSAGLLAALTLVYGTIAAFWEPFAAPSHFSRTPPQYLEVARYVRETTAPNDRVLVWGAYTPIYVMSDRLPASRFVAFKRGCGRSAESPFADCWDSGPEMWPLLMRDLAATAPALILDTSPANLGDDFAPYPIKDFPLLRDLLASEYASDRTVNGVVIYRRLPSGVHGT
jgi:hypothetical protein